MDVAIRVRGGSIRHCVRQTVRLTAVTRGRNRIPINTIVILSNGVVNRK